MCAARTENTKISTTTTTTTTKISENGIACEVLIIIFHSFSVFPISFSSDRKATYTALVLYFCAIQIYSPCGQKTKRWYCVQFSAYNTFKYNTGMDYGRARNDMAVKNNGWRRRLMEVGERQKRGEGLLAELCRYDKHRSNYLHIPWIWNAQNWS